MTRKTLAPPKKNRATIEKLRKELQRLRKIVRRLKRKIRELLVGKVPEKTPETINVAIQTQLQET